MTADDRIFYINDIAGTTQWDRPIVAASIPLFTDGNVPVNSGDGLGLARPDHDGESAPAEFQPAVASQSYASQHMHVENQVQINHNVNVAVAVGTGKPVTQYQWSRTYRTHRMYSMLIFQLIIAILV